MRGIHNNQYMKNGVPIIITHSGNFHADDALAVAALDILFEGNYTLIRTRDSEIIKTGDYVVDVGGEYDPAHNRFDHHQEGGAGKRENGIPYSAFGLVWKHFGARITGSDEAANIIDRKIAEYIDADDNGIAVSDAMYDINTYTFPQIIKLFRPGWRDTLSDDEGFANTLTFARMVLEKEIRRAQDAIAARDIAERAYSEAEDKRIVALEEFVPVGDMLDAHTEVLFVIHPAKEEGRWVVKAVKENEHTFVARKAFPKEWAGKREEEFAQISGVGDAYYCHHSGNFMCLADSENGAVMLAKIAADA